MIIQFVPPIASFLISPTSFHDQEKISVIFVFPLLFFSSLEVFSSSLCSKAHARAIPAPAPDRIRNRYLSGQLGVQFPALSFLSALDQIEGTFRE
jgi:hypothetical protein